MTKQTFFHEENSRVTKMFSLRVAFTISRNMLSGVDVNADGFERDIAKVWEKMEDNTLPESFYKAETFDNVNINDPFCLDKIEKILIKESINHEQELVENAEPDVNGQIDEYRQMN